MEFAPPKLKPFLLKDVHVAGKIVDNVADLVLTQKYYNDDEHAVVESLFFFPMHGSSIVHSVQAKIGEDRIINAKILDKETAHEKFTQAVDEGRTAAMMESLPESSDVFKLSLSHIPGKTEVVVTTKFCLPLKDTVDDKYPEDPAGLLLLPGSLVHRYCPATDPNRVSGESTVSDAVGATLEDIAMYRNAAKPYPPLVIELAVESAYALADIRVPSHADNATVHFSSQKGTGTVKVALDAESWLNPARHKDVHVVTISKPYPIRIPPVKLVTPSGAAVEEEGSEDEDYVPVSAADKEKQRQYALRAMQLRVDAYTPEAEPGTEEAVAGASAETSFPATGAEYLDYSKASAIAFKLSIPMELAKFVLSDAVPAAIPHAKQEDFRGLEKPASEAEFQEALNSMAADLEKLELSMVQKEEPKPGEYIFLLDRSGSMGGDRMEKAKQSLQLALRSLPMGSTFQVIFFDNVFNAVFPQGPVEFSDENLKKATQEIDSVHARGGTEILQPLEFAFKPTIETKEVIGIKNDANRTPVYKTKPYGSEGRERFVFLFTDGEVGNTEQVVQSAKKAHAESGIRVFTIGIGTNCSTVLLEGLAKATNARSEYIFDTEPFQAKVIGQMSSAMHGFYHLTLDWGLNNSDSVYTNALPEIEYTSSMYSSIPISFYGLFKKKKDKESSAQSPLEFATLTVKHPRHGEKTVSLYSLPLAYVKTKTNTNALALFAAKEAIMGLQGKDEYAWVDHDKRKRIVDLSTHYHVLSRYTAFFAEEVEVKNKPVPAEKEKKPEPVPHPLPIVRPLVAHGEGGTAQFARNSALGMPRMLARAAPMMAMMAAPLPMPSAAPPIGPPGAVGGLGMGAPVASFSAFDGAEKARRAPAKKSMSIGSRVRNFFGGSSNAAPVPMASFDAMPMMESASVCADAFGADGGAVAFSKRASVGVYDDADEKELGDIEVEETAPAEPAALSGENLMNEIVLLQNVAGVFAPLDKVASLANISGDTLATVQAAVVKQLTNLSVEDQDKVVATALALYVFENKLVDLQSSWMFVAKKAKDALAKLTGISKKDVNTLVQSVKDAVNG